MFKLNLLTLFLFGLIFICKAQTNYTANDLIPSYAQYKFGTNLGYYAGWTDEELADIAIGNPAVGEEGVGINALRASLPEHFLEQWGYDIRTSTFEHYANLGASENVVFIGYPSNAHRDPIQHCPGIPAETFANLYLPIWDNGANDTPINENNYYALYLYKMVSRYKDQVRFWEIMNEPDYDYSGNGWKDYGMEGNWFENIPNPCDYALRAPIYYYIRMLRISYEVIKSLDPEAYIALGGVGYPSFLDLILRHTDDPNGGTVSSEFPLNGGAYFDAISYHSYPHIDGSLRYWDNDTGGFLYERHSDRAVEGVLDQQMEFQNILADYGYDNSTFPEKVWIITECNLPRKSFNYFGSNEAQRNFIVKAIVETRKNKVHQFHTYQLGDRANEWDASDEFHLMGMYKNLASYTPYQESINDIGIAYKTTSDILKDFSFNQELTAKLSMRAPVKGGIFTNAENTEMVLVLWAATNTDLSEETSARFEIPEHILPKRMTLKKWDYSETGQSQQIIPKGLLLSGAPIFLTGSLLLEQPIPNIPSASHLKLGSFPNPTRSSTQINFNLSKSEMVSLQLYDLNGRLIQKIVDHQFISEGNYTEQVDLEGYPSGVYLLKLVTPKEEQTFKIIRK